jgi:hypothetical protein
VPLRRATQLPKRVLQAFCQCHIALAAEDDRVSACRSR